MTVSVRTKNNNKRTQEKENARDRRKDHARN